MTGVLDRAAADAAVAENQADSRKNSVVKQAYYEPEYLEREYRRLWPRVWQMVCREEELADVGDCVTYDIGNESIVVLRSAPGELRAFHNVCLHRGRRLVEESCRLVNFRCPFHGWRWRLDGTNEHVTQKEDWCGALDNDDLSLVRVRFETWAGFVFVTFDPNAEPLLNYLGEAAEALAPFELEKMRYRWRKWLVMPANWKVALEAFNEGYHVAITHYQLNRYGTSQFKSRVAGRHGTFGGDQSYLRPEGSTDHAIASKADMRRAMADFYRYLKVGIDSNMTDTMVYAAQTLPSTVPDGASPLEIVGKLMQTAMEIDAARGVVWPSITPEQYQRAGIDWHIFPNMVLLPMATNCLGYRARPNGKDPDSCIFEVYQLERMPKKDMRRVENLRNDDVHDEAFWGEILLQDFQQMEATHRGNKSSGYQGPRLNPRQETTLENFHRTYHEYLES